LPIPLALICLAKPVLRQAGIPISKAPSTPREAWPSKAPFSNSRWLAPWPLHKQSAVGQSSTRKLPSAEERGSAQVGGKIESGPLRRRIVAPFTGTLPRNACPRYSLPGAVQPQACSWKVDQCQWFFACA
ncbi:hypothetical protein CORC01_07997, partial [Colletotrichum orchidophilum]